MDRPGKTIVRPGGSGVSRLARVGAALAVLLLACIDGPAGPGNQAPARLQLTVSLPAGTPAVWQPTADTLHLEIRRAGRADAILDTAFVPGATLGAAFTVPLDHAIERFVATAEVRYGGLVLFLGFDVVQLAASGDTAITLATSYVGPGARAATYVLGARDTTLGQGDTASLVPIVRDSAGQLIPNVPARYVAARPSVVDVTAAGILTAQLSGSDTACVIGYLPMGLSSALLVQLGGGPRIPTTKSWVGGAAAGPTDWSDDANWDPVGAPIPEDSVEIDQETNDPVLVGNATVARLRLLGGNLTLNGHTLTVAGDMTTENGDGAFTMQSGLDTLVVGGDAAFDGDTTPGRLTNGVLRIAGDFTHGTATSSRVSFRASGNHRTVLNGSAHQVMRIGGGDPVFQHLDFANTAGGVDVPVPGTQETAEFAVSGKLRVTTSSTVFGPDVTIAVEDSFVTVAGSTLTLGGLTLRGGIALGGALAAAAVEFAGTNQPIPASVAYQSVTVSGTARLVGNTTCSGFVLVRGAAAGLLLAGHKLAVNGGMTIGGAGFPEGSITMTDGADTLIVAGDMGFSGGSSTGLLTSGTVIVGGGFFQAETPTSYAPSGSHRAVLNGGAQQRVSFAAPATSGFNQLDLANGAGGVWLESAVRVAGQLRTAAPAQLVGSGAGQLLTVAGVDVAQLTLDSIRLAVGSGTIARFDTVTFQHQDRTAAQLAIAHPGAASAFTFNGLQFLTAPTTGKYVSAIDIAPADGRVLTINLDHAAPADGSGATTTSGGAVVNWTGAPPPPFAFSTVSGGLGFSCGLRTTGAAYCWGTNTDGQLGDGGSSPQSTPTAVMGGLTFTAITTGGQHACALTAAGAAYCWGANLYGQLGDGGNTPHATPTAVSGGLTFNAIAAGENHTCAIATGGAAYCWGRGDEGQLGTNGIANQSQPTAVAGGLTFTSLAAEFEHNCALTSAGAAYCWGRNGNGQLGDGSQTQRNAPVAVSGGGGLVFATISVSGEHTCAVTTGNAAYCWGWNSQGELGDGTQTLRTAPVPVAGGVLFAGITGGGNGFTCGWSTAGAGYCWGLNNVGQLGNGTSNPSLTPLAVSGGLTFTKIDAGFAHVVAVAAGGVGYGWGGNGQGQLGDGSNSPRSTPTATVTPP